MTFHEADKLLRTLWHSLPNNASAGDRTLSFSQVARAAQLICPDLSINFSGDYQSVSIDNIADRNAEAAHKAELLRIERQVELAKKRLDAELEIQKYREKLEEIRATAERASKAPPGSLTFVPEPGDTDRRSP